MPRMNHGRSRHQPSPYEIALRSRPHTDQVKIIFPGSSDGQLSLEEFNAHQVSGHINPEEVTKVINDLNNLEGVKFSDHSPSVAVFITLICCFMILHICVFPCFIYVIIQANKVYGVRAEKFAQYLSRPEIKNKFDSYDMSWKIGPHTAYVQLDLNYVYKQQGQPMMNNGGFNNQPMMMPNHL